MPTYSEFLDLKKNSGERIPQRVYDVTRSADGLTEALYTNAILDSLGDTYPQYTADFVYNEDATVPTYADVINYYKKYFFDDKGVKDGKGRTALTKFVDDFPKLLPELKKKALNDPDMGERGWETVKKIWHQASRDKMNADIVKARKAAMEDDSTPGLFGLNLPGDSFLGKLMFRRSYNAGLEGRDPTDSEIAGDAISNLAYAVPAGVVSAPLKMAATKFLPSAIVGGGKLLASGAGQFAAPTFIYGADKVLGNETSWTDPVLGGLTNMGINKLIGPAIGKVVGSLGAKVSQRLPASIRQILEGTDSPRELAMKDIYEARKFLNTFDKTPQGKLRAKSFSEGKADPYTEEALRTAQTLSDIGDVAESKWTKIFDTKIKNENLFQGKTNPEIATEMTLVGKGKTPENYTFGDGLSKFPKSEVERYMKIFEENPALTAALVRGRGVTPMDMAIAYAVNQKGNENAKTGKIVGNYLQIPIEELIKEDREEMKKAQIEANIGIILQDQSLTTEDRGFLKDIATDPDIVKYGHPDKPEEFKKWMLLRGYELIDGTPAAVPTWEVER